MFKSTAKVEYHTDWIIASCDNQLLDYYRRWVWLKTGVWLFRPKHGAHISIVRGDVEDGDWERNLDGENIEFYYDGNLESHLNYIWLPVWGKDLNQIRVNVGMSPDPTKPFHMSIGNTHMDLSELLCRRIR